MRRRDFMKGISGSAIAWPIMARAQDEMPVIGYLNGGFQDTGLPVVTAFRQGLRDTGYLEGKNLKIEYRWANAEYDRLPELAADLVRLQVAVIEADTPVAAIAAKHATTSIPVVFSLGSDPVKDGLVASLNRPGGNVTGATFFSNLLSAKRLDLFHRLAPKDNVVALLLNPKNANVELEKHQTEEAARPLGLQLIILQASNETEIDEAVGSLRQQGATALIVSGDVAFFGRRAQIAELAMRHKIPTSCPYRDQVIAGCLMSYGANTSDIHREAGNYVGRILKGEKPADLPVQQPTKFELVINLQTAKTLGLDVSPDLLATADEVIE
jgi:putative tryptophan/tyrosine transport system substrate-binding protein